MMKVPRIDTQIRPLNGMSVRDSAQAGGCGCAVADTGGRSDALFAIAALVFAAARARRRAWHGIYETANWHSSRANGLNAN